MAISNQILDDASAKAELKKPLKDIYQAWPNLHALTVRLVDFMGEIIPSGSDKPLLEVCLTNAVNNFRNVSAQDYGTAAQMVAYIRGLLLEVPFIVKSSLGTKDDIPVLWEPFGESITEFQEKYPEFTKVYGEPYSIVKDSSVRLMVLARVVTAKDLYWIDQYSSLPTLLGESE